MASVEKTINILNDLIAYPTISSDSNLALIQDIADRLDTVGARVEILADETGDKANLFATIGPERDGGIVLSGHTDVVPVEGQDWHSDPFSLQERDAKLYGRGTCDMKGFIAACLGMADQFADAKLLRPVHFAFTYDEEIGCFGAQSLVHVLADHPLSPKLAIVGEPTSMRIIEGHKGCYEYTTRFKGFEGHGSQPELGVNAVEYAARFINRLLDLKSQMPARAPDNCRFNPPFTTLSTGRFEGGLARNIIAGKAEVEWEMRPVQKSDAEFIKSDLHQFCQHELLPTMRAIYPDSDIETQIIAEVEGLQPTELNEARDIIQALTGANDTDLVSFGTEAGLYQSLGMDVIVCGPGSIEQAHKPDEFLEIQQMQACLDMLDKLAHRLAGEAAA